MGRRAGGWKFKVNRGIQYARFTHEGTRYTLSTGERDPVKATPIAETLYLDTLAGKPIPGKHNEWRSIATEKPGNYRPLDELFAEWLASIESDHDEETVKTYTWLVKAKLIPYFKRLQTMLSSAALADYGRMRLKKVLKVTVNKEFAPIMGFLRWCKEQNVIDAVPQKPQLPSRATGVRSGKQRLQAVEISPDDADRILAALPEMSERKERFGTRHFVVRARFVFARETALRPSTINHLSVPEHYRIGSNEIRIADEIDKARFGRTLDITPAAREALEFAIAAKGPGNERGPIFGRHTYEPYLKKAALEAGLDTELAKDFAAYDFRHGRATEFLETSGNMPGTAYQLGHKLLTTTNKYVKANRRAGGSVILAMNRIGPNRDQAFDATDSRRENTPLLSDPRLDMVSSPSSTNKANSRGSLALKGRQKAIGGGRFPNGPTNVAGLIGVRIEVGGVVVRADAYPGEPLADAIARLAASVPRASVVDVRADGRRLRVTLRGDR